MNRFELWDKVARNAKCQFPRPFRLVIALLLIDIMIDMRWDVLDILYSIVYGRPIVFACHNTSSFVIAVRFARR